MLGKNLKQLRMNKGWSQEELAQSLHASRQTISKWETGVSVPDANTLIRIAELYNVSVSQILGESIEEDINLNEISNKLEILNGILASRENRQKRIVKTILKFILYFIIAWIVINILILLLFGTARFDMISY